MTLIKGLIEITKCTNRGVTLAFLIQLFGFTTVASAQEDRFWGTWVASTEKSVKCKKIDGEVLGFAIGKDQYIPYLGGFCDGVRTFLEGSILRVSGNCVSVEGSSYSAITNEFQLTKNGKIKVISATDTNGSVDGETEKMLKKETFVRCSDCLPTELHCVFGGHN